MTLSSIAKRDFYKKLRSLGVIACICALLTALAGCTGQNTVSDPSGVNSTSSQEASNGREVKDLNGYKWTYLSLWGTQDSRFNPVEGDSIADDIYLERNQQLMKDYHFEMEMKSQSLDNFNSAIMASAMAGEKMADIILLDYVRMQNLRVAEVLNPFDSTCMPAIDVNDKKWQKAVTRDGTHNGKVYGIYDFTPAGSMCFFNADLFAEKNITSPYTLYKEGKWTWEEFKKLAKTMTVDENGDGTPEIYGIGTIDWGNFHFEHPFIYANGGRVVKFDANGKPAFAYTDNEAQEALGFVKSLYDEKLVLPELPKNETEAANVFSTRKVAFVFATYGFVNHIKEMEDDFGMVPLPKGPSAADYVSMNTGSPMYVTTIGTPVEDYEASSLIFDLLTEPLPETGEETIDDPLYTVRNEFLRDDDAVQIYLDMSEKVVAYSPVESLVGLISPAISSCVKENATTPKSAMESIADQVQTLIDDFYTKKEDS